MLLELNGLEVDCIIGELPDERIRKQRLTIDAKLEIASASADSDDLSDTVDYAALGDAIRAALVSAECKMIERAAKVVYEICVSDPKVRSATVKVTKAGAVAGLASASVSFP
jgi:dihydroneopterin aldolase